MKIGHIRIKRNKVYFETDGLKKPKLQNYYKDYQSIEQYQNKLKKYEALKQGIEVKNVYWSEALKEWFIPSDYKILKNNQPCKAEIINNMAIISNL